MPVIHFEYTQFYYPGDMEFPGEELHVCIAELRLVLLAVANENIFTIHMSLALIMNMGP